MRNISNEDDLIVLTKCLQFQCQSKCCSKLQKKVFFSQTKENHCFVMETKSSMSSFFLVSAKKELCLSQHDVDDNVDDRFNNYNLSTAIVGKD